ncbi:CRISPR-associated protein Csy1 [Crateriforma conspicua]|uniref:CRISPR-associated protein Csy1 n=1 Tax=Crateriforma conspicua TaxID=2527996 RepID=A0A5C6FIK0_9PLAN|nr:type I-F CRISPR-associated protein Csy1 [Crateriforma conspicua]TWU62085.1 CRISPR-associated protein Csy1 [Crateriforma conspicua]
MTNPLRQFVKERRDAKLAKAKPDAVAEIESDFRFENWVQSAAKRASQLNVASHIGTISHPDAKIAPFVAEPSNAPDGYVRSGNVSIPWDAFGNAAALDALGFMKIELSDHRTALEHLREGTDEIRELFDYADDEAYETIRNQFLQMFANSKPYPVTCSEIKQVYFPLTDGDYHLLSLVSSSGLMRENRLRLQEREWGDDAKAARELERADRTAIAAGKSPLIEGMPANASYQTIPNRGSIKLGGANAQNVSSFNAECRGVWPLFASYREASRSYQRLAKRDYFRDLRWDGYCRDIFRKLHDIFRKPEPGNSELREARKQHLEELWLWASSFALELQALPGGWSNNKENRLPMHQKLWLDAANAQLANENKGWRQEVASDFAAWTLTTYKKMNWGDQGPVPLGIVEDTEFRNEVTELPFHAQEWQRWER